jgi:hypothetical protein
MYMASLKTRSKQLAVGSFTEEKKSTVHGSIEHALIHVLAV